MQILTSNQTIDDVSLAPLAVLPEYQRQGAGSKLVRAGIDACRSQNQKIVVVLGHPDYYPGFGFSAKLAQTLRNPFGGGDAWMALELVPGALTGIEGCIRYPPPSDSCAASDST